MGRAVSGELLEGAGWHPDRAGTGHGPGLPEEQGDGPPVKQQRILVPKNVVSPLPAWLWDWQFCVNSPCQEAAVRGRGAPPHSGLALLQGIVSFHKATQFNPFAYK